MVFVYIRIYYAAKARARRGIRKQPRKPPNEQVSKDQVSGEGVKGSLCHVDQNLKYSSHLFCLLEWKSGPKETSEKNFFVYYPEGSL